MKINTVLIKPILTEKATANAQKKTYMFEVAMGANKNQVKHALQELYKIKVGEVAVQIRKGKEKRVGRRMRTKQLPDRKIAYVTVVEGSIDLFPQA